MARKKINILTSRPISEERAEILKSNYSNWKNFNRSKNASFFVIYNSFRDEHLATLDAGPLRLYLYFTSYAKNDTGDSWHSIQRIAEFFNTQTRTIDNWIKVLVDRGLIYRERTDKMSNTTFILPYSTSKMVLTPTKKHVKDDQGLIDDLIKVVEKRKEIYGGIIKVYHLFQWKLVKEKVVITEENYQNLLIMTKKPNGVVTGHMYRFTRLQSNGINEKDIDQIGTFDSPFLYKNSPIKGVAINANTLFHLHKNAKDFDDLLEELEQAEDVDFDAHPYLQYGMIKELFEDEDEPEEVEKDER